jgi:hypothetical protein
MNPSRKPGFIIFKTARGCSRVARIRRQRGPCADSRFVPAQSTRLSAEERSRLKPSFPCMRWVFLVVLLFVFLAWDLAENYAHVRPLDGRIGTRSLCPKVAWRLSTSSTRFRRIRRARNRRLRRRTESEGRVRIESGPSQRDLTRWSAHRRRETSPRCTVQAVSEHHSTSGRCPSEGGLPRHDIDRP